MLIKLSNFLSVDKDSVAAIHIYHNGSAFYYQVVVLLKTGNERVLSSHEYMPIFSGEVREEILKTRTAAFTEATDELNRAHDFLNGCVIKEDIRS